MILYNNVGIYLQVDILPTCGGAVVVVIALYLDLHLPVQSVYITSKVVSSNPFMARCTRCNIMWSILSVTCDRSVVFYTNKTDRNDTGTTEIFQMKPACGKQIQDEEKQNKNTRQHVSDTTTRNQTRMV
jgi:hypothetical protein